MLHIALNDTYDDTTNINETLSKMESTYAPLREGIDIHHALLSKDLGGGIASVGALCDSSRGFGLSASLLGNFLSMDIAAVWDMTVFMHELG